MTGRPITSHTGAGSLSELMDFDHPVEVHADGTVTDAPRDVFAPSAYFEEGAGPDIDLTDSSHRWEPVSGFSGQHGYRGPIMNASELIAGGLAEHIVSTPGVYVALVVNVLTPEGSDDPVEDRPAGWCIARLIPDAD